MWLRLQFVLIFKQSPIFAASPSRIEHMIAVNFDVFGIIKKSDHKERSYDHLKKMYIYFNLLF